MRTVILFCVYAAVLYSVHSETIKNIDCNFSENVKRRQKLEMSFLF